MSQLPAKPDIGALLERKGLITEAHRQAATQKGATASTVAEVLIGLGVVTEDQIHFAVSAETGLPYLHLSTDMADEELVRRFPGGALFQRGVVPLLEDAEELNVAMVDPWDEAAIETIRRVSQKPLNISIAARGNVSEVLRGLLGRQTPEAEAQAVAVEDASGIALVFQQLLAAVNERASEIHFDATDSGLAIRFRIGGALASKASLPAAMRLPVFTRLRVMAGLDAFDTRPFTDRRVRSQIAGRDLALEFSWTPTSTGGSALLRVHEAEELAEQRPLGALLGDEDMPARLVEDLRRRGGVVALGLPSVRGRASTRVIPALLAETAAAGLKVVSLSCDSAAAAAGIQMLEPQEGEEARASIDRALGLAPDVIHLADVSDDGHLAAALGAALAGPAVLIELPYSRAADVMAHIASAGARQRVIAAATLASAIAIRPVAELCGACREKVEPQAGDPDLETVASALAERLVTTGWWRSPGCEKCGRTGRTGERWVSERLQVTARARELLRDGQLAGAIASCLRQSRDLALISEGVIGIEEAS